MEAWRQRIEMEQKRVNLMILHHNAQAASVPRPNVIGPPQSSQPAPRTVIQSSQPKQSAPVSQSGLTIQSTSTSQPTQTTQSTRNEQAWDDSQHAHTIQNSAPALEAFSVIMFRENGHILEIPCLSNWTDAEFVAHLSRFYYFEKVIDGYLELWTLKMLNFIEVAEVSTHFEQRSKHNV
jgi:hypothetical protein